MSSERIGPYRIEGSLGSGGMGEVVRAWDERLERPVAIKRLRAEVSNRPRQRERLRREARAAAQLNHPAIVQIYDIIEDGDRDCIVMELVEGRTLATRIAEGTTPIAQAMRLALDMAEGLAAAHSRSLVHRDLKPGNVIETVDGHAKILDFGIAKRDVEPAMTREGAYIGTYNAMAPEQTLRGHVDHRTDLFAFGLLLYELVTGSHPFPAATPVATMVRISIDHHVPACEQQPAVPAALSALIDRLLAKDPAQRPQSAEEVVVELSRLEPGATADGGGSQSIARLIDAFLAEGYPAKAIVMLKQLQRMDPAQSAAESKLASLVQALSARQPTRVEHALNSTAGPPTLDAPTAPTVERLESIPLFSQFSPDELTAVIRGMRLHTFDAGEILFSEGQPGNSLLVLASGSVRVYVRNIGAGNTEVRLLQEGAFFGEISVLSGKPRSATIVTCTACEVLVLERETLDSIAVDHPQILATLREIYAQRHDSVEEMRARIGPRDQP